MSKPYIASHQFLTALGLNPDTVRLFEWRDWNGSAYVVNTDRSHALIGYRVSGGRPDVRGRASALSASVELVTDWCTAPEMGHRFRITLSAAVASALGLSTEAAVRFTGQVTDVLDAPGRHLLQIAAAGLMVNRLQAEVYVSDSSALDGDRAAAVLSSGAVGYDPGTYTASGGSWRVPGVGDYVTAQGYLDSLSDSTLANLIEERNGNVRWAQLDHRGSEAVTASLNGEDLLNSFQWRKAVGDAMNMVVVGSGQYGEQTAADPDSISALDATYLTTLSSLHFSSYQAAALAWTLVGLFGVPQYRLPALVVDLARTVTTAEAAALMTRSHGHRLALSGLPAGPYTSTDAFVEGWTEEARPRAWRMELQVSDPYVSADSVTIADAPTDLEWSEVVTDLTFLDAAHVTTPEGLRA